MNECVFCKLPKEIPAGAGKIYEDEKFIAFLILAQQSRAYFDNTEKSLREYL